MRRQHPRRRAPRLTTIRDVARAAGVGVATASRAITDTGYASAATRKRVLEAARRLGYAPNQAARALRRARRRAIGVIVPDLGIPVYVEWLRAVEDEAGRHGYVLLICDARRSTDVARAQLQWLLEERVAGLLVAGHIGAVRESLVAFEEADVTVVPRPPTRPQRKAFRHDAELPATMRAFRHLVGIGHRRVAYLSIARHGRASTGPLRALRVACLRDALAEVGAHVDERLVVMAEDGEDGRRAASRLIRDPDPPTAFVAGNGEVTAPMLRAIAEAGLSVPRDVSVLAFDGSEWEAAYRPPISVVQHDYAGVGGALARHLIARVERANDVPEVPPFPSEFVDRGSIGPPPRRSGA